MKKPICVEGFKAFRGSMKISLKFDSIVMGYPVSRIVNGEWLYKPDTDCWYCNGISYPARVCEIVEVE